MADPPLRLSVAQLEDRLDGFIRTLVRKNVRVTVRRRRGQDIDAACGQLAVAEG